MLGDRESFGRNSFQLIRLVLAIAVLYRHSFDLLATGHADVVLDLIPPRTHLGRIALCFFMVVSGFLVAHSWTQSDGWRDFLWRRVLRVYPGFVVASVLSAFVAAPLGSSDPAGYLASIDVLGFVVGALQLDKLSIPPSFLSNPYPGPVNGSLWSIKIEFECYLGLMALGLVGVFRRRALMLGIFALMLVAHAVQPYVPSSLDRYAHHLQLARSYGGRGRLPVPRAAPADLRLAGGRGADDGRDGDPGGRLRRAAAAHRARTCCSTSPTSRASRAFRSGRRVDLSYGIYLYAWPVQQLLIQAFGAWLNP